MQLLILFLISIQFIFCSGVELLQNPGQLTEHEENTGKNIQPIEGLNKVVTDVMKLFVSAIRFVGMKDRKILKRLNNNYESIQEQYIYFSYLLGLLNNKLNLIIEHINTHPNTELTLNIQQPIPELYQILINRNKYMQNIIILALNLIKGIINKNILIENQGSISNQNSFVSSLDAFKNKLIEYINLSQPNDIDLKLQVYDLYRAQMSQQINIIQNQIQRGNDGGSNARRRGKELAREHGQSSGSGRG